MKLFFILLFFSWVCCAEELSSFEIEESLDKMVRENIISAIEAERIMIQARAKKPIQRSPASASPSSSSIQDFSSKDIESSQLNVIKNEFQKKIPEWSGR